MPTPVAWQADPSGAVQAHFDDGSSMLLPPNDPHVAQMMAVVPQGMPQSRAPAQATPNALPPELQYRSESAPQAPLPVAPTATVNVPAPTAKPPVGTQGSERIDPSKLARFNGNAETAPTGPQMPMPTGPTVIPGTAGRLIKGGRTPQSWQTQEEQGLAIPDEAKALFAESDKLNRGAIEAEGAATLEENRLRAQFQEREQGHDMLEGQAAKDREARRSQQEQDALDRYDQFKVIDPNRVWNSKTGMEKFVSNLQVAGDAFVRTWLRQGGENQAMKRLQAEIDADVHAQMANLQNASADIQQMYGSFDREDARIAAGKAAHNEAMAREFEGWTTDIKDARTKAAMDKVVAGLDTQAAEWKIKAAQLEQGKKTTVQHDVQTPDKVVGGSPARIDSSSLQAAYMSQPGNSLEKLAKDAGNLKSMNPGMTMDQATARVLMATAPQWMGNAQGAAGPKLDNDQQKEARDYTKELNESGVQGLKRVSTSLLNLAAQVKDPNDKIPGFSFGDKLASNLPTATQGLYFNAQDRQNRADAEMLARQANELLFDSKRPLSPEAAEVAKKISMGNGSGKDLAHFAAIFRNEAEARQSDIARGYSAPVVQSVHARTADRAPKKNTPVE